MSVTDNYIFDLDENVTRKPASYKNRYGISIAADLYRPKDFDASREHPAIVVGAPYGGVKEQGPGIYAQNLALRGFVALAFDPSYNGYSGGEPRHVSSPDLFVEDFSAAVDYLGTRPFVDRERIGVIGMCGSGAFSLAATKVDRRIKAVATVVMYYHHRLFSQGFRDSMTDEERHRILDSLAEQRYADFERGTPTLTPRDAPIGFDETTDPIAREFGEFYSTPRGYRVTTLALALASRWEGTSSHAVDPGWVPTRMGGAGASDDLTAGHQTQVWLATHHDVIPRSGGYWYHQQVQGPHPASQDEDFQAHLIEVLENHTGTPLD